MNLLHYVNPKSSISTPAPTLHARPSKRERSTRENPAPGSELITTFQSLLDRINPLLVLVVGAFPDGRSLSELSKLIGAPDSLY